MEWRGLTLTERKFAGKSSIIQLPSSDGRYRGEEQQNLTPTGYHLERQLSSDTQSRGHITDDDGMGVQECNQDE